MSRKTTKPVASAIGAAVAGSMMLAGAAGAADNPFGMTDKRVFDLVKDFGTSESPKSTRPSTTHWCPGRPGHPAFRHNIASSLRLHTGLPYDWTPRSDAPLGSPLAPSVRRVSRVASRLPGTTRLRFALHGGQRLNGGYLQTAAAHMEGKYGSNMTDKKPMEGKCGGNMTDKKPMEGKCGGNMTDKKPMEGKCGGNMTDKKPMEGKCGGNMTDKKPMEGKCGAGKCGGMKKK